jgi:hypothetical protein
VIESTPNQPIYTFTGHAAKNARTRDGSGVQLPVGEVAPARFKPKSGFVTPMVCEDIEIALAEAQQPLADVVAELETSDE